MRAQIPLRRLAGKCAINVERMSEMECSGVSSVIGEGTAIVASLNGWYIF